MAFAAKKIGESDTAIAPIFRGGGLTGKNQKELINTPDYFKDEKLK